MQGQQMQGQQMQGQQMQGQQMQGQQMQGQQMQGQQMQGQQMQGQQMQGQQMQGQQMQGQTSFDYSFNTGGENLGNDFNAAYSDKNGGANGSNGYEGIDSFDGVYQHNSITGPVKNLSDQSGDLGGLLEQMKNEREQVNNKLVNVPKPTDFDPMQSPSQQNGNQSKQFNDFFF
jgi:hypothetical protein